MLELQFSLLPERPYQGRTSLHGTPAIARTALQVVEVGGAAVGQLVMLQMSPDDQQRLADLLPEGAQEWHPESGLSLLAIAPPQSCQYCLRI